MISYLELRQSYALADVWKYFYCDLWFYSSCNKANMNQTMIGLFISTCNASHFLWIPQGTPCKCLTTMNQSFTKYWAEFNKGIIYIKLTALTWFWQYCSAYVFHILHNIWIWIISIKFRISNTVCRNVLNYNVQWN